MKTSEGLDRAADLAEKLEHCKDTYAEHGPGEPSVPTACCTKGAVLLSVPALEKTRAGKSVLTDAMHYISLALVFEGVVRKESNASTVITWNDRTETTKADVVRVLRKAANLARENEPAESMLQACQP